MTVETANILLEYANKINALNEEDVATSKAGEITSFSAFRQSFCAKYDKKTRAYPREALWFCVTWIGPLDFGRPGRTGPTGLIGGKVVHSFNGFVKRRRRTIYRHSGEGRNPVFQRGTGVLDPGLRRGDDFLRNRHP
jgi:hypothetical protein